MSQRHAVGQGREGMEGETKGWTACGAVSACVTGVRVREGQWVKKNTAK